MTVNNLSLKVATVIAETLTDGSIVYDVLQPHAGGKALRFVCVARSHADQLAALLNECADIRIEE